MRLTDLKEKFTDRSIPVSSGYELPRKKDGTAYRPGAWDPQHRSRRAWSDILDKQGWTHIGRGMSGSAFTNPAHPDQVLKVFTPKDRGYMRFYSMAKRTDNPHFPEVGRMGYLDYEDDETEEPSRVFAVTVEKLTPTSVEEVGHRKQPVGPEWEIIQFLESYMDGNMDSDGELTHDGRSRYSRPTNEEMLNRMIYIGKRCSDLFTRFPELQAACHIVMKAFPRYVNDVGSNNVMWRGQTPVFTDALCGNGER